VACKLVRELQMLVSARHVFGNGGVVHLEPHALDARGVGILHRDKSDFPSVSQCRGLRRDALRVVAEPLVERGARADRAVDLVGQGGLAMGAQTKREACWRSAPLELDTGGHFTGSTVWRPRNEAMFGKNSFAALFRR